MPPPLEVQLCSGPQETHCELFLPHPQHVFVPLAEQALSGEVHEQSAHAYNPNAIKTPNNNAKNQFFFIISDLL
jgi:hypothetical protein